MTALGGVIWDNDNLGRIGAIPCALIIWKFILSRLSIVPVLGKMVPGSDINTLLIHIEENVQVFILIYRRVR
jgi:hypothetical protein